MASDLNARRKAGDRFYLALVDPLLKRPAYFELKKPVVTVGFLPGCDWVIPWSSMGIDVITDSRRFDSTYPWNSCQEVDNSRLICAPRIGKREKEPFFRMVFDPVAGWSVECDAGHGCRVNDNWSSTWDPSPKWVTTETFRTQRVQNRINRPDRRAALEDGDTFPLIWPVVGLFKNREGYVLPTQVLRFVFVACHKDEYPVPYHLQEGPRHLLALPKEALAIIASHFPPNHMFLSKLPVVGRVFTSPSMEGRIPWKKILLTPSFNSLRIAHLASAEAVREVQCMGIWARELRPAFYAKWKRVICHEFLKVLDIEDPSLLCSVGVPPNLRELRIRMEKPINEFWYSLEILQFPDDLSRVCIRSCLGHGGSFEEEIDPLSPKWLFSAFPGLKELHLRDVLLRDEEWIDVPSQHLEKLTHLYVKCTRRTASIPLKRMSNLVALQVKGLDFGSEAVVLPRLEYLSVEVDDVSWNTAVPIEAPNLRFLQIGTLPENPIKLNTFRHITRRCPKLQFLYVKSVDSAIELLRCPLNTLVNLKDFEISGIGLRDAIFIGSASMQVRGRPVRATWRERGTRAVFDLMFSSVEMDEREEVMKIVNREMHMWQFNPTLM